MLDRGPATPEPDGLPPGPRAPGPIQTLRYTFDQPGSFADMRARFGPTFTLDMPGFPPRRHRRGDTRRLFPAIRCESATATICCAPSSATAR